MKTEDLLPNLATRLVEQLPQWPSPVSICYLTIISGLQTTVPSSFAEKKDLKIME